MFEVVFYGRLSSFEVFGYFSLIAYVYIENLDKILPVVAELQSICTAAGWMGGWLVKSVFNTTPSAILQDGSFLWTECIKNRETVVHILEFIYKLERDVAFAGHAHHDGQVCCIMHLKKVRKVKKPNKITAYMECLRCCYFLHPWPNDKFGYSTDQLKMQSYL